MKFRLPFRNRYPVSNPFGPYHKGIDFSMPEGIPIIAAAPGKVIKLANQYTNSWHTPPNQLTTRDYGNYIKIDHGEGFSTLYAHLAKVNIALGSLIPEDCEIAKSGNTGNSTGPHLHFEIRKNDIVVDPVPYWKEENSMDDSDELDDLRTRLEGCREERSKLRDENEELKKQKEILEVDKEDAQKEVTELKNEVIQLKRRLEQEMETDTDFGSQLLEAEQKIKDLEEKLGVEKKRVAVASQELEKQNGLIEDTQAEARLLRTQLADATKQVETLSAENARLERKLKKSGGGELEMQKKDWLEALKEVGRYALFGLVAYLIAYLSKFPETETTVLLLGLLRFFDKYLHEKTKKDETARIKGLAPF